MRTLVSLPVEDIDVLAQICKREGVSRAELIRRAIADYLKKEIPRDPNEAFGIWKTRKRADGLKYQKQLRAEWGKR